MITGGVLWPFAFIWAYANPGRVQVVGATRDEALAESAPLAERLQELTARVEALESTTPATEGDA